MADLEATLFDGDEGHLDEDLFGDVDDLDEGEDAGGTNEGDADAEADAEQQRLEYDEEDEPGEFEERHERIAEIPVENAQIPGNNALWQARLPNYLALETQPFDKNTWEPTPGVETSAQDDAGFVRWRTGQDGKVESNSRIVEWDDGTFSLQVGDELFDIAVSLAPGAKGGKVDLELGQESLSDTVAPRAIIAAQHDYVGLSEAQAAVYGTMAFRPVTLHSRTHHNLAGRVADRYAKTRAVKVTTVDRDPEAELRNKLNEQTKKRDPVRSAKNAEARRNRDRYREHREGGTRLVEYGGDSRRTRNFDFDDESEEEGDYEEDDFVVDEDEAVEKMSEDEDDLDALEARIEKRR